MALSGNGTSDKIRGPAFTAPAAFTALLRVRKSAAPGTAARRAPFFAGSLSFLFELELDWDSTIGTQQSWRYRDGSGTDHTLAYTTALQADTWYVLACRLDGTDFSIWLNGAEEAAAVVGAPSAVSIRACLLADAVNGQHFFDGDVAELAWWDEALDDRELAALGGAAVPLFAGRGSTLRHYLPLVRSAQDLTGRSWTTTGTTAAAHPPVRLPVEGAFPDWGGGTAPAAPAATAPASSYGVFGPITRAGRVVRAYRRRAYRWGTYAADSMNKSPASDLGTADTGHSWQAWTTTADLDAPFVIVGQRARPAEAATGTNWAALPMGQSDVRLRARVRRSTLGTLGVGLFFRGDADGAGLLFRYDGASWLLSEIDSAGAVTDLGTLAASPALATGTDCVLEVRCLGTRVQAAVDGVAVGGEQVVSQHQRDTSHGFFIDGNAASEIDNLRISRYTGRSL